jgi:hypothetical protein
MIKKALGSILFVFLSFSSGGLAQDELDEIDSRLFLNVQLYNVPLGGIVLGTGAWLKKNINVCAKYDVFIGRNDDGGDPNQYGCYVMYGPINEGMTKWTIRSLIVENWEMSSFEFEFGHNIKEFMLIDFRVENMEMDSKKFESMFMSIVNSKEAKNFGK